VHRDTLGFLNEAAKGLLTGLRAPHLAQREAFPHAFGVRGSVLYNNSGTTVCA